MEEKKFELTDETREWHGHTLHRIKALKDFADVKAGDIGGYVTNKNNLSQKGNCWIYDNGKVYGKAKVYGNARVSGNALVTCVYGRPAFPNPDEVPAKIVGAIKGMMTVVILRNGLQPKLSAASLKELSTFFKAPLV